MIIVVICPIKPIFGKFPECDIAIPITHPIFSVTLIGFPAEPAVIA